MTLDDDGLERAPWYVRAFVRIGMPTSFAAILLWYLLTNVTGLLQQSKESALRIESTQSTIISNQQKIIELLAVAERNTSVLNYRWLAAVCYNTAQTDAERVRCREV